MSEETDKRENRKPSRRDDGRGSYRMKSAIFRFAGSSPGPSFKVMMPPILELERQVIGENKRVVYTPASRSGKRELAREFLYYKERLTFHESQYAVPGKCVVDLLISIKAALRSGRTIHQVDVLNAFPSVRLDLLNQLLVRNHIDPYPERLYVINGEVVNLPGLPQGFPSSPLLFSFYISQALAVAS